MAVHVLVYVGPWPNENCTSSSERWRSELQEQLIETLWIFDQPHHSRYSAVRDEVESEQREIHLDRCHQQAIVDFPADLGQIGQSNEKGERRPFYDRDVPAGDGRNHVAESLRHDHPTEHIEGAEPKGLRRLK